MPIRRILILGAGSAGLMAAVTLKRKLPHLEVTVVRSPELGVIGVGEGTTPSFPRHFFNYLRVKPQQFFEQAEPTWKLGIKFLWGTSREFYYTFARELEQRLPDLPRNHGFYHSPDQPVVGPVSACLTLDRAFARRSDGGVEIHNNHAYHVENRKLVGWLESLSRAFGVEIRDGTVTAERGEPGIVALVTETGERLTADLYLDASGFRSELLGGALAEPFRSFGDALFCDRAVIGGWPRTDEPIRPYTVAETMDGGWCWQIEHEHWINRGYVYASAFMDDATALEELRRKNPKIANEPRLVKFRSGRYARNWVGNVVGIGNSVGFVEPLEATALQLICVQTSTLADSLIDSQCEPTPTLVELYNRFNGQAWDDIRDFLAIHYRFNTRTDTPYWQACRHDTKLHGAEFLVDFYRENGPSVVAGAQLLHASNSFGMDGYLTLLLGQGVAHGKPHQPTEAERRIWENQRRQWEAEARRSLTVREGLDILRKSGQRWA